MCAAEDAKVEEDHDFDDLDVGSAAYASRRAAERQLAKEVRDLRDKKLERLAEMKKEADEKKAASEGDRTSQRLEYLMRVSTEYTNIAHTHHKEGPAPAGAGAGAGAGSKSASSSSGKRAAHRLTEKEEDEVGAT